jgi:hypothetical protein
MYKYAEEMDNPHYFKSPIETTVMARTYGQDDTNTTGGRLLFWEPREKKNLADSAYDRGTPLLGTLKNYPSLLRKQ